MEMYPREVLCSLVAQHGSYLARDARRCEALLRDHCGQNRREINVLLAGVRGRVGADLVTAVSATPRAALLARLCRRLCDEFALEEDAAQWSVESWALALGIALAPAQPAIVSEAPAEAPAIGPQDLPRLLRAAKTAQVFVNPIDDATMLWIPGGEFLMGDDDQKDNPRRRVYLDAFWMYKNPVTVSQFMHFCGATGHAPPEAPPWGWRDDHPVVNVSWHDAAAYGAWSGTGLPTEAQWERAARGADGRLYPWGDAWDASRCAHSAGSARTATVPAGSYAAGASPLGLLDMAGNVWEWCADWYGEAYMRTAPGRNPEGPLAGERRVLRGGSWNDNMPFIYRTAMRFRYDPTGHFFSFGFRCAASADEK